tara:strand:+ start:39 stop:305 length:267 start_codon:yes stop_codon:yes gene_type:complete
MSKIYLAMASVDYEGSSVMRAFSKKHDANEFISSCNDYNKTKEECPVDILDESLWDEWSKNNSDWIEKHPAKVDYYADEYYVNEIDLT